MVMSKERWRDVVGYEGIYKVSSLGRVRSLPRGVYSGVGRTRRTVDRILRPRPERYGYLGLVLCRGAHEQKTCKVHRLVLEAFVGPCPQGHECAHNDGDPANNKLENLRWATPVENQADSLRHGTHVRGEQHKNSKLSESAVREIRKMSSEGISNRAIAKYYGVSHSLVGNVLHGKAWAHVRGDA